MGAVKALRLPRLGETMERGRVIGWAIEPGADYRRGDVLLEVETDKTIVEVPALEDGRLLEILAEPDSEVEVDAPLARVEVAGEAAEGGTNGRADATSEEAPAPASVPIDADAKGTVADADGAPATGAGRRDGAVGSKGDARAAAVSPRARHRARELGVDAAALVGSGRRGRVVERDVLSAAGGDAAANAADVARASPAGGPRATRAERHGDRDGPSPRVEDDAVATAAGELYRRRWLPADASDAASVTLLHGLFGDVDVWAECGLRLARGGRTVTAWDLPAHGRSTVRAEDLESCLAPLRERLEAGPPTLLVGHSFGGLLAARLAAALPARVRGLVLVAPLGLGRRLDQTFLDALTPPATLAVLEREIGRLSVRALLPGKAHLRAQLERLRERADALRGLIDAVARAGLQSTDIRAELDSLAVPVRLVWGLRDPVLDWRDALSAPPRCALHLLPEVGHMPMWEAGELVASLIEACVVEGEGGAR